MKACDSGCAATAASIGRKLLATVALLALSAPLALAADHDDTPALKALPGMRRASPTCMSSPGFNPGPGPSPSEQLVLSLSTNPTIPPGATSYAFPSDLTLTINVDRNCKVDFLSTRRPPRTYGGTILNPATSIRRSPSPSPSTGRPGPLCHRGLDKDAPIRFFAGLRDDPFIRGPRQGRNVGCVVFEMPLQIVAAGRPHKTLLVWATPRFRRPADRSAISARVRFAPNSRRTSRSTTTSILPTTLSCSVWFPTC